MFNTQSNYKLQILMKAIKQNSINKQTMLWLNSLHTFTFQKAKCNHYDLYIETFKWKLSLHVPGTSSKFRLKIGYHGYK